MASTTVLQSMGNDHHQSMLLDGFPTFCPNMPLISPPPPLPENGNLHDATQQPQMLITDEKAAAQQQDPGTMMKKREERDRAKLRYNEKKKNRKYVWNFHLMHDLYIYILEIAMKVWIESKLILQVLQADHVRLPQSESGHTKASQG